MKGKVKGKYLPQKDPKKKQERSGIAHLIPKVKAGSFLLTLLMLERQHIISLKDFLLSCRIHLTALQAGTG